MIFYALVERPLRRRVGLFAVVVGAGYAERHRQPDIGVIFDELVDFRPVVFAVLGLEVSPVVPAVSDAVGHTRPAAEFATTRRTPARDLRALRRFRKRIRFSAPCMRRAGARARRMRYATVSSNFPPLNFATIRYMIIFEEAFTRLYFAGFAVYAGAKKKRAGMPARGFFGSGAAGGLCAPRASARRPVQLAPAENVQVQVRDWSRPRAARCLSPP